jgi:hypothetical protein
MSIEFWMRILDAYFFRVGFFRRSSATRLYVVMIGLVTQPADFLFLHACFVRVYALCALFWSLRCVRFWGRRRRAAQ